MGPRLVSRGNTPNSKLLRHKFSLQWGRDSLVAEMSVERPRRLSVEGLLQWGRDSLVAEIAVAGSFLNAQSPLQWGRDSLVAEITAVVGNVSWLISDFNGAATR